MPSFNIPSGVSSLYLICDYTVGQYDIAENTTPVTVAISLRHGGLSVRAGTDDCTVWVGSKTHKWTGPDIYSSGGTVSLGSYTFTANHDSEGKWSGKIGGSYRLNVNYGGKYIGTISGEQDVTLPTIPRASGILATNANIGDSSTIVIDQKSTAFTHTIQYKFGNLSGYLDSSGKTSSSAVKMQKTTILFPIPESFYSQIPAAKSGTCTLTCRTYSGNTQIGSDQQATFTVGTNLELCAPVVSGTVKDVNPVTVALTGDESVMVKFCSTAQCTISATAQYSAWITEKSIQGVVISEDTATLKNVETNRFLFYAADSRGHGKSYVQIYEFIQYVRLTCNILRCYRPVPTQDVGRIELSGNYFTGSFGAEDNTLSLQYKSVVGDNVGAWVDIPVTMYNNSYKATVDISGLDYRHEFNIEIRAVDKINTVSLTTVVRAGIPVFDWGRDDFRINVPLLLSNSLGYVNMPILYMENDTADTEERFEAALTEKLAQMPNESMTFVLWSCHPKVTGQNVYSALIKHNAYYAVLVGFSYGAKVAQMFTKTLWNGTWQESHPTTL